MIQDEKRELIVTIETWCNKFNVKLPTVDTTMRLDVLKEIFNVLKRDFWDK